MPAAIPSTHRPWTTSSCSSHRPVTPPRSEKYEVAIIGEGAGEMGPLAAIGQFASVDSASGMGCVVSATCGYTRQKCVYDTLALALALARTTLELGHSTLSVQAY